MKKATRLTAVIGASMALMTAAAVLAHEDDPKALATGGAYAGPGWRLGMEFLGGGFDSSGVELLAWMAPSEFPGWEGGAYAADIWGYVSPSGREYALVGMDCSVGFVEVTVPTDPQLIGEVSGVCETWRDMRTYEEYAYIVTDGSGVGVQIVDLSQIDSGIINLVGTVDGIGGRSHNVIINEATGYLYRCGGSAYGLGIYNLEPDASSPVYVTTWEDRYVHDAQVVVMQSGPYAGREIAFCCAGGWNETGLDILDVTDKGNIVTLASYQYPNGVYSHQGRLSEDQQYFFLGDEIDEGDLGVDTNTKVIDVSNLNAPFEADVFSNGDPATDHNLFVKGDLIFEANYQSGLRVFDASDPLDVTEIAYFDTFPETDDYPYLGLWGTYPFLPSGIIIGNDRARGLFIWQLESTATPGDVDGDGDVDFTDLLSVIAAWGPCPVPPADCPADFDGSGVIDFTDLLTVLSSWSSD